jgi:hypothetical protein
MPNKTMNDQEMAEYEEAIRSGRYLTALDVVLRSLAPEGASDEEIYGPLMDTLFPPVPTRQESEKS